jgi:hypothetical protein
MKKANNAIEMGLVFVATACCPVPIQIARVMQNWRFARSTNQRICSEFEFYRVGTSPALVQALLLGSLNSPRPDSSSNAKEFEQVLPPKDPAAIARQNPQRVPEMTPELSPAPEPSLDPPCGGEITPSTKLLALRL